MKAFIRKTARTMAGWPVVGRLVKIAVAVIRLPELRDSLQGALRQHSGVHIPVSESFRVFETEQLPSLLQAVSEVNHRQLIEANGQNNLVRSVPVALRKMTRDIVQLREQNDRLQAQVEAQAATMAQQYGQVEARLNALDEASAQVHALRDQVNAGQTAQHTTAQQAAGLAESVQYLLGRVEFVRRELMFEMRYGATNPGQQGQQLTTTSEIIEPAKVEAARQGSGIRLNLGCGHVPLQGYLNVDRRALPGVDIVAEVDQLPFAKGEVAEICSAHLLEHFPIEQLRRELLPYWVSLLRADGVFRAIVPDGANMARAFATQEYSFDTLRQVTFGGQDYDGDFHYAMFSTDSLAQLLREAGFNRIEVVAENRENGGCKEFELLAAR